MTLLPLFLEVLEEGGLFNLYVSLFDDKNMLIKRKTVIIILSIILLAVTLLFIFFPKTRVVTFNHIDFPVTTIGPRTVTRWKYIVIHHSGTTAGNAERFHKYHTDQGWGGLAYHFVIDNGRGGANGRIETGFRWKKQKRGGHVAIPLMSYNIHGIGICMVGNLNKQYIKRKQLYSLTLLTVRLMKLYNISVKDVVGHREVPYDFDKKKTYPTDCPGKTFNMDTFRRLCHLVDIKLKRDDFTKEEFEKVFQSVLK
jgi:N-acetyl-anhydromuramyl-L-alanine amidase AmpD